MTPLVLVVLVLQTAALVAFGLHHRHPTPLPDVLGERLARQWVITLKSGSTFRGVLTDHDAAALVLSDAEAIGDDQTRVPVDGEIVVLLADVKYAQRL